MYHFVLDNLCTKLSRALKEGFHNGDGREGIYVFISCAYLACCCHAHPYNSTGKIEFESFNTGGSGASNSTNVGTAIKMTHNARATLVERECLLRDPAEWLENFPGVHEYDKWRFKQNIPDVVLHVKQGDEIIGGLVAEVKSNDRSYSQAQIQAFIQSLAFLKYNRHTASMVVNPKSVSFTGTTVENGRLLVKKKLYPMTSAYEAGRDISDNTEQFKALFSDIVLYLWNTYFEPVYNVQGE